MRRQLARLFGFVAPRRPQGSGGNSIVDVPFEGYLSDEVSEYDGILLVRLGAGLAMQVRLHGSDVLTRTVPIAKVMQIREYPPWEPVTGRCIQAWMQSDAAIWRWLLAKGINVEGESGRPMVC